VDSIKAENESDDEVKKMHEAEDTDNEDESDDSNDDNDVNVIIDKSVKKEEDSDNEKNLSTKRPSRVSNDVSEGKTIFLKNVPFSVKNDELEKYMEQFGPVYYALVCIDPLTEYSRGTAFVKFQVRITNLSSHTDAYYKFFNLVLFVNIIII